jgi:hypothetical protein
VQHFDERLPGRDARGREFAGEVDLGSDLLGCRLRAHSISRELAVERELCSAVAGWGYAHLFQLLGGPEDCLVALEATRHYWRNLLSH